MRKPPTPTRRRAVVLAALASIAACLPTLLLNPMRETHHVSDKPFYLATGLCMGLSIAMLIGAITHLMRSRRAC
ncbi:MAG TPA: hypothetical protein VNW54_05970 [Granulicella sp.]|jgi:hypothetical protein|nr:hypothetical protein [Granulicella sp.]